MPFIARLNSPDGALVSPAQAEKADSLYCPECGGSMGIRGGHNTDSEEHFWHVENLGNGNGGSCAGAGQATPESEIHRRVKAHSVAALRDRFGSVDIERIGTEIPIDVTDSGSERDYRRADALAQFQNENRLFGEGLIIEIQYRHADKNIPRVSADVVGAGYSILWLDAEEVDAQPQSVIPDIDMCLNTEDILSYTPYHWNETDILDAFHPQDWFSLPDEWQFKDPGQTCTHEFEAERQEIKCLLCRTLYEWHEPSHSPIYNETYKITTDTRVEGERPDFPSAEEPHVHHWFAVDTDSATADPRYRESIRRERCGECRAAKVTDSKGHTVVDHKGREIYEIKTSLMRKQEHCDHTWHQYEDWCIQCEIPKDEADTVHSNDWF